MAEAPTVDKTALAQSANEHYRAGDYDAALECLTQLSKVESTDDPRLEHNIALTTYAKEGFRDASGFLRKLGDVRATLKGRAKGETAAKGGAAAGEGEDDAGAAALEDDEGLDGEAEHSALLYNQAVMQFQAGQLSSAGTTLRVLFANREAVDEGVSAHVCFLLLEVLLHSSRGNLHSESDRALLHQEAQRVLSYLEKLLEKLEGEAEKGEAAKDGDEKKGGDEAGKGAGGAAATDGAQALQLLEFRLRLQLARSKVLLAVANTKQAKKEVKSAFELIDRKSTGAAAAKDKAAAAKDSATPKLKDSSSAATTTGSSSGCQPQVLEQPLQKLSGVYLQANLEYLRENYSKAFNYLTGANTINLTYPRCKARLQSLYFNNMGCVHFRLRRYRSAASYFGKALGALKPAAAAARGAIATGMPAEGSLVEPNNECEIMYNCGIQLLMMGKPEAAFNCFQRSAALFHHRPRLWLRLGECCIRAQVQKQQEQTLQDGAFIRRIVGAGVRRRLQLPVTRQPGTAGEDEEANGEGAGKSESGGAGAGRARPTLRYAITCFRNVLALLSAPAAAAAPAVAQQPFGQAKQPADGAAAPAGGEQLGAQKLRQAALLNMAYAALCIDDFVVALSAAQQLIAMKDCTPAQKYVARCYCAEALCYLSRPQEALEYLQPPASEGQQVHEHAATAAIVSAQLSGGQGGSATPSQQQISAQARCGMMVNLATVHVLLNDLVEAENCARRAISVCNTSADAARMLIYIMLRKGETARALQMLKDQRTVPSV